MTRLACIMTALPGNGCRRGASRSLGCRGRCGGSGHEEARNTARRSTHFAHKLSGTPRLISVAINHRPCQVSGQAIALTRASDSDSRASTTRVVIMPVAKMVVVRHSILVPTRRSTSVRLRHLPSPPSILRPSATRSSQSPAIHSDNDVPASRPDGPSGSMPASMLPASSHNDSMELLVSESGARQVLAVQVTGQPDLGISRHVTRLPDCSAILCIRPHHPSLPS
jgi:hypothetical protein